MFDESTICPYSGLRSFTEDESIFFKGRDKQIDQITKLLEKNKFLMVTGASGEGKSSLVYAGMIPNAKAGFFRAKYNNWQVVDFRPERTPLTNFTKAISAKFSNKGYDTVFTELQRGYSSLVELYRNSNWYFDENNPTWQQKSDEDKISSKREASNLMIIVDQFEEFFTNPENFQNSTPSEDSQITLNLLLETAKIALEEDLAIYVVCTMRSDYIGQCSAFRGLPEAIGFSQFFVPRLKRNELKLIIEEPAYLNGNKISSRLVERLLFDLAEGIDQLPILQHALNHIWHAADKGKEELDLIHYALVGGMPAADLPDEDKSRFLDWYKGLPEFQRKLYHSPGIKRVIEIHANELYEGAYNYYKQHSGKTNLPLHEVKHIVAITFACLTKIDDSRAVRNRMTLEEITGIINRPHITTEIVNDVLNIFREPDNSFIRPFITNDPASTKLSKDTVLDITHESLIRNWGLLNKWANKEFEYYTTFLDFRKQLNRWLESGKSKGYLLPVGPLSYFESWVDECKPNKYWIHRYEGNNGVWPDTLAESGELLDEANLFLKRSNRKALFTRTFMKYGANRIAAGIAIIFVLFLSGFYFIDAEKKRNDNILVSVTKKGYDLMPSRFIPLQEKARFLIIMERKSPGSMMNYLKGLTNSEEQIDLAIKCYDQLLHFDNKFNGTIKSELIRFLGNSLKDHNDSHPEDLIEYIQELNLLTAVLSYDYYYNSPQEALDLLVDLNQGIYERIKTALGNNNLIPAAYINRSMQFYLTFNNPTNDEVGEIITLINPFEDGSSKDRFNSIYPAGELSRNGRVSINHNGGYHLLASLFATIGDQHNINRSLDSLATAKDYYIGLSFNGPANILGYLYQYHHEDLLNSTITRIAKHSGLSPLAIRRDLIDRSGYLKHLFSSNINATISESNAGYYGPNLIYLSTDIFDRLIDDTRLEIEKIKNNDERHYQLALLNKQAAIFRFKLNYDKGLATEDINSDFAFGNFIDNYRAISDSYLAGQVPLTYRYYGGGLRQRNESRKHILLYPDYIGGFFSNTYHTTSFVNYLYENNLVNELYTGSDIEQFNYWLANAHEIYSFIAEEVFKNEYPIGIEELERLRSIIASHPNGNDFNQNLMTLLLVNKYFETDNQEMAIEVAKGLDLSEYDKSAKQFEYLNEAFFLNQVREYASNLALIGEYEKSIEQLETFNRDYHKIQAYVLTANTIYENSYDPITFDLLDTAYSYRSKINEATLNPREEYRDNVIRTLALIGGGANEILINEELKQIFEGIKPAYIERKAFSYALGKDYYAALRAVDADLTEAGELRSYYYILLADLLHYDSKGNNGQWHAMKKYVDHALNYKFNVRGL